MKGIQDTSTRTFRELLGNGTKYEIPKFQRDYSWNVEQWDDLWQDVSDVLQKNTEEDEGHYMGYLVLQTTNNKLFRVIDGQQRISTISILILTAIKCLHDLAEKEQNKEENQARAEELVKRYIGVKDPITLGYDNKLVLNRNNNAYYKEYLVSLGALRQRGITATERLMKNCFEWFYSKVKSKYKTGTDLATFVEEMVDRLYFTTIKVGDELNAFRVFETLNARGVQLSSSDLLKNYLFSLVDAESAHEGRIKDLELKWSDLLSRLGKERLPEFLRYYWNSHNRTVRKNELFKTIRKKITSQQQVFELINDLLRYADIYVALKNPNDEEWKNLAQFAEIRDKLKSIAIFGVKQPFSLLMVSYDKLPLETFIQVLKHSIVISFRHTIIGGLNTNDLESVYNTVALKIYADQEYNQELLRRVYVNDSDFETTFANKEIKYTSRNKKVIKYILAEIEKSVGGSPIDLEDEKNTVEHVLPQNPSEVWKLDDSAIERSINRIGNLALLSKAANQEVGTLAYTEKVNALKSSAFLTTQAIAESYPEEWSEETIISRQQKLAKFAKQVWRINF